MAKKSNRKGGPKGVLTREGISTMHPFDGISFDSDRYYNGIINKISHMLMPLCIKLGCDASLLRRMALSITAYFEDQVSQLGLWSAFIHRHKELYGKWLPWYDTTSEDSEYYEDEVNLQDIKFLIWMICVSIQQDSFIPPCDSTIEYCASEVFEYLLEEFESAPVNEDLAKLLYNEKVSDDFYQLKKVLVWLTQNSYLMVVPSWQNKIRQGIRKSIIDRHGPEVSKNWVNYFETSYTSMRMRIGPLALFAKEWYVLMRQQKGITKDNDKILNIDSTPYYPFIVESNNGDTLTLRSVRDEVYQVESHSFNCQSVKDFVGGENLHTMLANYDGVWRMNGTMTQLSIPEDKDRNEIFKEFKELGKHLQRNNRPIDLFGMFDASFKKYVNPNVKDRIDYVIAQNNGRRLFYFPNPLETLKWEESVYGNPFEPKDAEAFLNLYPEDEQMIAFIKNDYTIYSISQASTIKDPNNPYYDPKDAYLASELLYNKSFFLPDEFTAYVMENGYLSHLNFNIDEDNEENAKLIADNLYFWATFMRLYPF